MKILIAIDGPEYSEAAVEECCRAVIHTANADVLVVSVCDDIFPLWADPSALDHCYDDVEDSLREQVSDYLKETQNRVSAHFPEATFPLNTEILQGSPAHHIVEKAEEWGADVIVVGSHGHFPWGQPLGSVANAVVNHAPCSVLVVRTKHAAA
jgi:nucleotide-binding universal stress UspA family protein